VKQIEKQPQPRRYQRGDPEAGLLEDSVAILRNDGIPGQALRAIASPIGPPKWLFGAACDFRPRAFWAIVAHASFDPDTELITVRSARPRKLFLKSGRKISLTDLRAATAQLRAFPAGSMALAVPEVGFIRK
jgi:hypothetical protein